MPKRGIGGGGANIERRTNSKRLRLMNESCVVCEKKARIHAMIDGNDANFCSETCIQRYCQDHPTSRVTIIEYLEKEFIWRKYVLHHKLTVVCCINNKNPHIVKIEEILLIGTKPLPFAYCPEHKAYFGISADVDMTNMIITLKVKNRE